MTVKEKRRGGAYDCSEMHIGYTRRQLVEMLRRTHLACQQRIARERAAEQHQIEARQQRSSSHFDTTYHPQMIK